MFGHQSEHSVSPYFSVIVPTYNRAEKVKTAALSVLAQTFEDFELLIIDDGSNDDTKNSIEALNDNRIRYEWAPNSGGPATPRNRGIDLARGQWICFLDADDIWYPEKLQIIRDSIILDPKCDVICNDEYQRNLQNNSCIYLRCGPNCPNLYQEMLVNGNRLSSSATVVRKEVINKLGIRFNQSRDYFAVEDYDFFLKLALYRSRFKFLSVPLGEYLIDGENISAEPVRNRHNLGVLLQEHVFKIQKFESNRDQLWRRVSLRLKTYDIKVMIAKRNYFIAAFECLKTLFSNPIGTGSYAISLFIRRSYQRGRG